MTRTASECLKRGMWILVISRSILAQVFQRSFHVLGKAVQTLLLVQAGHFGRVRDVVRHAVRVQTKL